MNEFIVNEFIVREIGYPGVLKQEIVGELVRCKDCKYAHLTYDGDCKQCDKWLDDDDFHLTLYLDGDFYCGYAERKDDAETG